MPKQAGVQKLLDTEVPEVNLNSSLESLKQYAETVLNGDIIQVKSVEDLETVIQAIEKKYSSWGAAEKQALESDLNNHEITQEEYDRLTSPGGAYYETYVRPAQLLKEKVSDVFSRVLEEIRKAHEEEKAEIEELAAVNENAAGQVFLNSEDGKKITAALKEVADGLTAGLQTQNPLFFAELSRRGEDLKNAGPLIHPLSTEEIGSKIRERETARQEIEAELNDFLALGQLAERGMAKKKHAPKDKEAPGGLRICTRPSAPPLLKENREKTLKTLKERGISLREYIHAAENHLESELKAAYMPPVQEGVLNLDPFQVPDQQDLQRCFQIISGKREAAKVRSFLPEVLSMLPPEDFPGMEKPGPFHIPVGRGIGSGPMDAIMNSCFDGQDALWRWIPDLSKEKMERLKKLSDQFTIPLLKGVDQYTKIYPQDQVDAVMAAFSEYRAILQSEYERLHQSGTNPVGELKARYLMMTADSVLSGISYNDLDHKSLDLFSVITRPMFTDLSTTIWTGEKATATLEQVNSALKDTPFYSGAAAALDYMEAMMAQEKARRLVSWTGNGVGKEEAEKAYNDAVKKAGQSGKKLRETYHAYREFVADRNNVPEILKGTNLDLNLCVMGGDKGRGDKLAEKNANCTTDFWKKECRKKM